jgi:cytochrome b6-f complex iron-sulfur subunit
MTRRALLKLGLIGSGWLVLKGLSRFLGFQERPSTITKKILDPPDSYRLGSVTPIPDVQSWLVRDEDGLFAVTAVCTHLGCLLQHTGERFECPCHGSTYQIDGQVISGPAVEPLRHVSLSRSADNRLVIDTNKTAPKDQRL